MTSNELQNQTQPAPAADDRPVRLAGLLALTFIHPGIGQVVGAIDLPVSREAGTSYPYIAGTSFKGALRDVARRHWGAAPDDPDAPSAKEKAVFGATDEAAGSLILSDIRLLLLPVRSLDGAFRYVTCPHIIARFATDLRRAGTADPGFTGAEFVSDRRTQICDGETAVVASGSEGTPLFLEELALKATERFAETIEKVAAAVVPLLPADFARTIPIADRLAVVSDRDFAWFARLALPVRMRNCLDDKTKTVKKGQLWSEEYLAPDTVMYALIARRGGSANHDPLAAFAGLIRDDGCFVQIGGNETVGHGWFEVALPRSAWPAGAGA